MHNINKLIILYRFTNGTICYSITSPSMCYYELVIKLNEIFYKFCPITRKKNIEYVNNTCKFKNSIRKKINYLTHIKQIIALSHLYSQIFKYEGKVDRYTFLGIILDSNLTYYFHIINVCNKLSKIEYLFRKLTFLNICDLILLYN